MRSRRWVNVFERAVLVVLALPVGCGGRSIVLEEADAGHGHGPTGADSGPIACLAPDTTATCSWSFVISGDPTACVGFPGGAEASQCRPVCGLNSEGNPPDACYVQSTINGLSQDFVLYCSNSTAGSCSGGQVPPGIGGR